MYSDWVWLLALGVFIWLFGLTFFVLKERSFLKNLFPKTGERDIRKKFEEIFQEVSKFDKNLSEFKGRFEDLEKDGLRHIQKVALLRYNPYDDTGGDQSFSVALLSSKGTGIVFTSLHARNGTRVFAKSVLLGKADKYQFSKEESEVIKKALE